jgi:hypothetical protein
MAYQYVARTTETIVSLTFTGCSLDMCWAHDAELLIETQIVR